LPSARTASSHSTGHYTGFDYVVEVRKQVVRLTTAPEDLVFQEL
jgi:hypothetical protein